MHAGYDEHTTCILCTSANFETLFPKYWGIRKKYFYFLKACIETGKTQVNSVNRQEVTSSM